MKRGIHCLEGVREMKEYDHRYRFAAFLSGISVLLSLLALLAVIRYCYPEVEQDLRHIVSGLESSPVRQAFHTMADGLGAGEPIKETMKETAQVLFG